MGDAFEPEIVPNAIEQMRDAQFLSKLAKRDTVLAVESDDCVRLRVVSLLMSDPAICQLDRYLWHFKEVGRSRSMRLFGGKIRKKSRKPQRIRSLRQPVWIAVVNKQLHLPKQVPLLVQKVPCSKSTIISTLRVLQYLFALQNASTL